MMGKRFAEDSLLSGMVLCWTEKNDVVHDHLGAVVLHAFGFLPAAAFQVALHVHGPGLLEVLAAELAELAEGGQVVMLDQFPFLAFGVFPDAVGGQAEPA